MGEIIQRQCKNGDCKTIMELDSKSTKRFCDPCVIVRNKSSNNLARNRHYEKKKNEEPEKKITRKCKCKYGHVIMKPEIGLEYCDDCDYARSTHDEKGRKIRKNDDDYTPSELEEVIKRRAYQKQWNLDQKAKRKQL